MVNRMVYSCGSREQFLGTPMMSIDSICLISVPSLSNIDQKQQVTWKITHEYFENTSLPDHLQLGNPRLIPRKQQSISHRSRCP